MKTIAVVGTGTAGITSLAHLLAWLPEDWTVISIHDPKIPILGIGESTSTSIPESLWYGAKFNFLTDCDELDCTPKFGVRYENWRKDDFFLYLPPPHFAMHFNNFKLKEFCFKRFKEIWKEKFSVIEGEITNIENLANSVNCNIDQRNYTFDYLVDCRGYPTDYTDYDIIETIPMNHALTYMIHQPGDWNFTYHKAHKHGWMFGIPLKTRQGWGYLYNDEITSRDEALENMKELISNLDEANVRDFSWKRYKAKKFIDGRIIKNGNRALFYEPMEALSGWFYDRVMRAAFDVIQSGEHTEQSANESLTQLAEDLELFICYMYHGGSIYNTKFWQIYKEKCTDRLVNDQKFINHIKILSKITPEFYKSSSIIMPFPYGTWHELDKAMNYHYFTSSENQKISNIL